MRRSRKQTPLAVFCDLGYLSEIQSPHLQTTARIIMIPSQVVKKIYNDSDNVENAFKNKQRPLPSFKRNNILR